MIPRQSAFRKNLPALALLLALTVAFYWKLCLTDEYVWFDHPDMCYIELPRMQFQAREFHSGHFPMWDPFHWMGQPSIGQTQPGPLFPLNILFSLLPLKDGHLDFRFLNWYFVLVRFIAAVCAYALCRDLRRSRAASLFAGCAFAFGGFVGSVAWLDVVNGALLTPAICLFLLRAARGIRPVANAALCGLLLGLTWLSGHHELPMLITLAVGFGWVYVNFRSKAQSVVPAGVTFGIMFLVGAAQIWPTYEYAMLSKRWVGVPDPVDWSTRIPYLIPSQYSLTVRGLLETIIPSGRGHADTTPFLGVVVTVLAACAVLTRWRVPAVRWFVALAVLTVLYSLGARTPLHGILYSLLPALGKARIPVRAIHLLNFATVILAAYGIDRVAQQWGSDLWGRRVAIVLVVFGVVLVGGATVVRPDLDDSVVQAGMVAWAVAAILVAWQRAALSRGMAIGALLTLMIVELNPVITRTFASRFDPNANKHVSALRDFDDIAEFLRTEPAPRRVAINDTDLPANFGDWYGIDTVEGYSAGSTVNLLRLERHLPQVQDMLGVTHYVAREPNRKGQVDAFEGATGVKVFRNPTALPRAWSVHATERVPSDAHLRIRMAAADFDARKLAVVTGDVPALESCEGDQVDLVARAANRVRVRARMACRGLVILSETYYPGWRLTVDGKEADILEVDGALRGVVTPAGEHELNFVYRPLSVYGGGALTLAGVLAAAILAVAANRQSR